MTQKVDETIEVLCDWIQRQLDDGRCDTSHQIPEMVKTLAELVSASANQKMASRMYEKGNVTRQLQK